MDLKKGPKRSALGRGLSALISSTPPVSIASNAAINIDRALEIPSTESGAKERIAYLPIEAIDPNPFQPREAFSEKEISELSASIKELGVIQPLLVRSAGNRFELVAGERRLRAAKEAELIQIPVIIKEISDRESLEIALVENVQRENLSPIEEAKAYQRLSEEFSLTHTEVADKVGKDRATVANLIRLLKLPSEVLSFLNDGTLSVGHAKAILSVKEPHAQITLAKKASAEGLSVRELEAIVSRVVVLDGQKRSAKKGGFVPAARKNSPFPELVDRLRSSLGTKVHIRHRTSGQGRIEIEYYSESELERLSDILTTTRNSPV